MYKIVWADSAKEDLLKLDQTIAKKIKEKIENYLVQDPINRGEPLTYQYKGYYRYRFSNYRVIYQVKNSELLIIIVGIGHRRGIYKK